ncbi:MAG: M1 family metallopeptidase [Raineya sp.]|jgi:hypothetical protein|nr:M1 family metallopeptidase [Raineya sp.]
MKKYILSFLFGAGVLSMQAQVLGSKFEQLDYLLPTPNTYRTADGSPGHEYWQQRADYKINVTLDDTKQWVKGSETITYYNNSPNELRYLWLQLDQNMFSKESNTYKSESFDLDGNSGRNLLGWASSSNSPHGFVISNVKDSKGGLLQYKENYTMMRIDLPEPLKKGQKFTFSLDWSFYVIDANKMGGRGGYEFFPTDGNYLYEMAQWFPRMCVYNDVYGWQHKQFLGRGEFALVFGDYEVNINVPADHVVAATGELQNASSLLTPAQLQRWEKAKTAKEPVVIVTQEEAVQAEKKKASERKTWTYKAQNVRDFAWASSRKFIWDAFQVDNAGKKVWAMSYYPKEGNPLWGEKSTWTVAHTLNIYSKYSIDYPYPVAISVHGPVFGMEYPMICFNGGRPIPMPANATEDDKKKNAEANDRTKYAMVSVIIHEVGHNYFPMIINSDERQWSWMDEGLNSFLQFRAEQELPEVAWTKDLKRPYPSRRGPAANIVGYMKSAPDTQVPIMTNSEQVKQFGNNAYGKPATALNVLRETVMGKELFDYAFKQYSNKWKFKHPEPADFFRTMEDASGVDLDWFWRGWFYTVDFYEPNLESVTLYKILENGQSLPTASAFPTKEVKLGNAVKRMEENGIILSDAEKKALSPNKNFYVLKVKNNGELVMPLIVEVTYKDGTKQTERFPAEIWRMNHKEVFRMIATDKEVSSFRLDPNLETTDTDTNNNTFPRTAGSGSFDGIKEK